MKRVCKSNGIKSVSGFFSARERIVNRKDQRRDVITISRSYTEFHASEISKQFARRRGGKWKLSNFHIEWKHVAIVVGDNCELFNELDEVKHQLRNIHWVRGKHKRSNFARFSGLRFQGDASKAFRAKNFRILENWIWTLREETKTMINNNYFDVLRYSTKADSTLHI